MKKHEEYKDEDEDEEFEGGILSWVSGKTPSERKGMKADKRKSYIS
jgi:hypothetical protein